MITEETRIKRKNWALLIIFVLATIGMGASWAFMVSRPQKEKQDKLAGEVKTQQDAAAKLAENLSNKQKEKDKEKYLKGQVEFFRGDENDIAKPGRYRRFYFDLGKADDSDEVKKAKTKDTWRRLMNEYHNYYGVALRQELIDAANDSGVLIQSKIQVATPPLHPEDVQTVIGSIKNGLLKPLGSEPMSISITGTLENLMAFMERVTAGNIMMVIGNIKLEGYSPNIKATFTLTPYLLATGPSALLQGGAPPAATTPAAGAPAAGGAPAGAPAGAPKAAASEEDDSGGGKKKKGGDSGE